jgi:hypothetical protein
MVSFQETAFVSAEMTSRGHRQSTAACVSLSKSTMSKTHLVAQVRRTKPGGGEERRI